MYIGLNTCGLLFILHRGGETVMDVCLNYSSDTLHRQRVAPFFLHLENIGINVHCVCPLCTVHTQALMIFLLPVDCIFTIDTQIQTPSQ